MLKGGQARFTHFGQAGQNSVSDSSLEGPSTDEHPVCFDLVGPGSGFPSASTSSLRKKGRDPGHLQLDAPYVELEEPPMDRQERQILNNNRTKQPTLTWREPSLV